MLVASAAMACSGPGSPHPAPPVADAPLTLGFDVVLQHGGSIPDGATIADDENFAVTICLSREAYVYLGQLGADGEAALLYPPRGAGALLAAGVHRIPREGEWLYEMPPDGDDHLIVVASEEPIEMSDPEIAAAVGEIAPGEVATPAALPDASVPDAAPVTAASDTLDAGATAAVSRPTRRRSGAARRPPRDDDSWQPDPQRMSSFHPRGLVAREIRIRTDSGEDVTGCAGVTLYQPDEGVIVRIRTIHHEAL